MYDSARPVQSTITDHMNKSEADAVKQQEWINSGHVYYGSTLNTIKQRIKQAQHILEIYSDIYQQMTSDVLETVAIENNDIIEETDLVAISDTDMKVIEQITSEEPSTGLELLDYYIEQKESGNKEAVKSLNKSVKKLLGNGFEFLDNKYIMQHPASPNKERPLSTFSYVLSTWFNERCDWKHNQEPGFLKYNLAAVPQSIDALILAYSSSVCQGQSAAECKIYSREFLNRLTDWVMQQGEGHQRGQPDPYKYEHYGLLPLDIYKYTDSDYVAMNLTENVLQLALYIERTIKSAFYKDYMKCKNQALLTKYAHSIECTYSSEQYLKVSTRDLGRMITELLTSEEGKVDESDL